MRRGARVVESGSLENCCTFAGTVGSNPTLSAINCRFQISDSGFIWNKQSGILNFAERCKSG